MQSQEAKGPVRRRFPAGAGDSLWLVLAVVLFGLQQIAIRTFALDGAPGFARRAIFVTTTVLLVVVALHYRRYFGAWLIAAGIAFNLIPMVAHGGLMPVSYHVVHESKAFPEITSADIGKQLSNGKDILLEPKDIHFPWLADRYIVTLPGYGTNIYSLGDFVLFGGVALVVIQVAGVAIWSVAHRDDEGHQPPIETSATHPHSDS